MWVQAPFDGVDFCPKARPRLLDRETASKHRVSLPVATMWWVKLAADCLDVLAVRYDFVAIYSRTDDQRDKRGRIQAELSQASNVFVRGMFWLWCDTVNRHSQDLLPDLNVENMHCSPSCGTRGNSVLHINYKPHAWTPRWHAGRSYEKGATTNLGKCPSTTPATAPLLEVRHYG